MATSTGYALIPRIPLREAWLCISCENVIASGQQACPECGSQQLVPLAKWLGSAA